MYVIHMHVSRFTQKIATLTLFHAYLATWSTTAPRQQDESRLRTRVALGAS